MLKLRTLPSDFARETWELVASRTRIGLYLGGGAFVATALMDATFHREVPGALAIRGAWGLVVLVLVVVWERGAARRWPLAFAAAVDLTLSGTVFSLALLMDSAEHPYYALQEDGLLILALGTGAILPIGAARVAGAVAIPVALQAVLSVHLGSLLAYQDLYTTIVAAVIGVVASETTFRLRLDEYEARVEKDRLLRAQTDTVAMLSHDMKGPLGVALGLTELLRGEPSIGEPDWKEILDGIEVSARRALGLAVNLVDAARIESGKMEVETEPARIGEVVRRVVGEETAFARSREITIETTVAPGLPELRLDVPAFERLVKNLLNNAIKFSTRAAAVRVDVRRRGPEVVLAVGDRGPGVPEALRGALFQRYGHSTRSAAGGGSGLGLFIVRTIAEAHGGRASASFPPEGGSVFEVTVPTPNVGDRCASAVVAPRAA